jgi:hypothetical protein
MIITLIVIIIIITRIIIIIIIIIITVIIIIKIIIIVIMVLSYCRFWVGQLAASGDPAAACCSHIAELQNPGAKLLLFISQSLFLPDVLFLSLVLQL